MLKFSNQHKTGHQSGLFLRRKPPHQSHDHPLCLFASSLVLSWQRKVRWRASHTRDDAVRGSILITHHTLCSFRQSERSRQTATTSSIFFCCLSPSLWLPVPPPLSLHFTSLPLPPAAPSVHQHLLFTEKQDRYHSGLNGGGGIDCSALLTAFAKLGGKKFSACFYGIYLFFLTSRNLPTRPCTFSTLRHLTRYSQNGQI